MRFIATTFLLLFTFAFAASSQSEKRLEFGVSAATGLHFNLAQKNVAHYNASGTQNYSIWSVIKGKRAIMAFRPELGLYVNNYRYELESKRQTLINRLVYYTVALQVSMESEKKQLVPVAGLYVKYFALSELAVRESNTTGSSMFITYSNALENIDKDQQPNKMIAGMSLGCVYQPNFSKRCSLDFLIMQDALATYKKNVAFVYSVYHGSEKTLNLNARPTAFMIKLKVRIG